MIYMSKQITLALGWEHTEGEQECKWGDHLSRSRTFFMAGRHKILDVVQMEWANRKATLEKMTPHFFFFFFCGKAMCLCVLVSVF